MAPCIVFLLATLLTSWVLAQDVEKQLIDGAATLRDIASIDAVYAQSLTIGGVSEVGPHFMTPGDPGAKFRWRFTRSGEEMTLHRERLGVPQPKFIKQGDSQFVDYDDKGNMFAPLLKEEIYHFSPAERFRCSRYLRMTCSPDGSVIAEDPFESVDFFPAEDPRPTLAVNQVMWSSGRGFSNFVTDCREATQSEDGLLKLVCNGFDSPGRVGTWMLVVDPRSSFVVLEASYTPDFKETPSIVIKNTGVLSNGSLVVAEATDWKTLVGMPVETDAVCEEATFEVDQALLELGRRCKQDPGTEHTIARDHRSGVQVRIERPELTNSGTSTKTAEWPWIYWFLLIVNAHVVLGGLVWLIYRYFFRKRPPEGPVA